MSFVWRLVHGLSSFLEPAEREAVLGDFAESGLSGRRALGDLLSLLGKRQAALWAGWGPWVALIFLLVPVGYMLSESSLRLSGWFAIHLRTLWTTGERYHSGMTAGEEIIAMACQIGAVVLWTWTGGFTLGSLARKTAWVHGTLFFLAWLIFGVSLLLRSVSLAPSRILQVFVFVLPALAMLAPSIGGVRQGLRLGHLGKRQAILLMIASAVILGLAIWTGTWPDAAVERWSEGAYQARGIDWNAVVPRYALLSWPILYILAASAWRHGSVDPQTN